MEIGKIEQVDLRDVWAHEAHDLTPWLRDNGDVLAEALGIDLELTASEHPVGSFSLDLIGRDLTNDCVLIVENQLTTTDHDHLGKLLTYAAGTDAQTVVWVAPAFRDEHRQALAMLNELGGGRVRFFGVELRAIRIGMSPAAPLLEVQAQPNDWHALVSAAAQATSQGSGKPALYLQFWARFLERVRDEHPDWTKSQKPSGANWFSMPSPFKGGPYYACSFAQKGKIRSEIYIDYPDPDLPAALFAELAKHKAAIELSYGGVLTWEPLPERRACRIADYAEGDVSNVDEHDQYIDWFFDRGERLRKAIGSVAQSVKGSHDAQEA